MRRPARHPAACAQSGGEVATDCLERGQQSEQQRSRERNCCRVEEDARVDLHEIEPREPPGEREPQHALQSLADALPALGIVAAVLGVVKTMGSIDEPPAILGGMIGSALVGTFLGVLLAYGIVGPMASRLKQVLEQDEQIFHVVKQVIIASLHGHPQPLVVESARSGLGDHVRPRLTELLDALRGR